MRVGAAACALLHPVPWRCGHSLGHSQSGSGKAGRAAVRTGEEEPRRTCGWVVQLVGTAPSQDLIINV